MTPEQKAVQAQLDTAVQALDVADQATATSRRAILAASVALVAIPAPPPTPVPPPLPVADICPALEVVAVVAPIGASIVYVTARLVDPKTGQPMAVRHTWPFEMMTSNGSGTGAMKQSTPTYKGDYEPLRQWCFLRPGGDSFLTVPVKVNRAAEGSHFFVEAVFGSLPGYPVKTAKVKVSFSASAGTGGSAGFLLFTTRPPLPCPVLDPATAIYDPKFDASFLATDKPTLNAWQAHPEHGYTQNGEGGYYFPDQWRCEGGKLKLTAKRLASRFTVGQSYFDFGACLLNSLPVAASHLTLGIEETITERIPTSRGTWPAARWNMPVSKARYPEEDQHEGFNHAGWGPQFWNVAMHHKDATGKTVDVSIKIDLSRLLPGIDVSKDRMRSVYEIGPKLSTLWVGRWNGTAWDMHEIWQGPTIRQAPAYSLLGLAILGGADLPPASFVQDELIYEAVRNYALPATAAQAVAQAA